MSATKIRTSCFSPNFAAVNSPQIPGLKRGPNGTMFISSGILDLDKILGGGLSLGKPSHGDGRCRTLAKDDKSSHRDPDQEKGFRIAWQYKKYFWENQQSFDSQGGKAVCYVVVVQIENMSSATNLIFGSPWRGNFEAGRLLIALAFKESSNLVALHDHCATFLSQFPRDLLIGCDISEEDKELEKLLTGNMVGLLNVHKVAGINTQVHVILESTTFSINLKKRRFMVLECLNQVPIDGSSGNSYGNSSSCSVSSKTGTLDF
ncbi:unnamed protein product [Prunus armeniaca]|uniref:Uncharacterized protein n=1 Tax=Prunus armeniaca TaxID=36596 RepID=A0A6J5XKI9_PRUAR|nr:unnamed protein product [Prunus armeniaca]